MNNFNKTQADFFLRKKQEISARISERESKEVELEAEILQLKAELESKEEKTMQCMAMAYGLKKEVRQLKAELDGIKNPKVKEYTGHKREGVQYWPSTRGLDISKQMILTDEINELFDKLDNELKVLGKIIHETGSGYLKLPRKRISTLQAFLGYMS